MNPRDLDPNRMKEVHALTPENGCTIYALAGAIAILEPTLSEQELTSKIRSIISIPIEETPLYPVSLAKSLPAPLLVDVGYTTAVRWIKEGEGDVLMNYLNQRFSELQLDIGIGFIDRKPEDTGSILQRVDQGEVVLLSCTIYDNDQFDSKHHVTLAKEGDEYIIIDINNPVLPIPKQLIQKMLDDPNTRVGYLGDENLSICVNEDPLIIVNKK